MWKKHRCSLNVRRQCIDGTDRHLTSFSYRTGSLRIVAPGPHFTDKVVVAENATCSKKETVDMIK